MHHRIEDRLDPHALDIATKHLLKGWSFEEIAREHAVAASTIHRVFNGWLKGGRFDLADTRGREPVLESAEDKMLADELVSRTGIWRARVATVPGTDAAGSEDYLLEEESDGEATSVAAAAHQAADNLHAALGRIAADVLLDRLRPGCTVGLASGRGVGFTVFALTELVQALPSRARGCESTRVVSLCGGQQVGSWAIATRRALDADANAFELAAALKVREENVAYMREWISVPHPTPVTQNLDVALVGAGLLNSRHFFYRLRDTVQLAAMREPLTEIQGLQARDQALKFRVGEMGHRLFPAGGAGTVPEPLMDAINAVNRVVVAATPEAIHNAGEVILVAGGAQKLPALYPLLTGRCPEASLSIGRVIFVTDSWTARRICEQRQQEGRR